MKILFVVEHFYPYIGGAEELFLGLAKGLVSEGHEVTVVTTLYSKKVAVFENLDGIKIYRIKCSNRYLFTFLSLPRLFQLARKCDIIHTTSYNAAIPAFIAGKLYRKKTVITFHEVFNKLWFTFPFTGKTVLRFYYLFEKLVIKLPFQKYIAVSESTKKRLTEAGINPEKIHLIYNGMDYSRFSEFQHKPPTSLTCCFFGRLGLSKGIDILLMAVSQFIKYHPDAKLKLIIPTYPDNLYKKVLQLVADLKLQNHIIILHDLQKERLLFEVSQSTFVIIPSLSEGFCFTAAEAVAMNIPVLSSGKGALREVVGGKHLHLEELSVENLLLGLQKAASGRWETSEKPKFYLTDCIESHINLYRKIA